MNYLKQILNLNVKQRELQQKYKKENYDNLENNFISLGLQLEDDPNTDLSFIMRNINKKPTSVDICEYIYFCRQAPYAHTDKVYKKYFDKIYKKMKHNWYFIYRALIWAGRMAGKQGYSHFILPYLKDIFENHKKNLEKHERLDQEFIDACRRHENVISEECFNTDSFAQSY